MRKSYSFLEKKLQETEQAHEQNEDIKPRIEFLKYILSSELSPHPSNSIPRPLLSISEKLTRLESGYLKGKAGHNNDPMPELETVKGNHESDEKSRGLKMYWCGCLIILMTSAIVLLLGAILMLSFCGCSGPSGYYYHDNIGLQYALGFITPT